MVLWPLLTSRHSLLLRISFAFVDVISSADETSPGKNAIFHSIHPPHLPQLVPGSYWTSTCQAALSLTVVNNFMSCHRFNLTCCREITHFPVTWPIVYTTIYFQSTAALRTAFSMFLSYIVWLFRTMPLLSAPEIVPTSMYNSCRKAARDIPDGLFFFQFM